jgi:hypothetical protein
VGISVNIFIWNKNIIFKKKNWFFLCFFLMGFFRLFKKLIFVFFV